MASIQSAALTPAAGTEGSSNTGALVIVTLLFFMWGLLTSLNDVLIPHLKAVYTLTYLQAILTAVYAHGHVAMWAILAVGLCNSIMFPTIFSMALHGLGKFTGHGSGFLCMAIVGGALVPFAQGLLADKIGVQASFLVPAACYAFILFFRLKYASQHEAT